jgi:Domain of unknown function (DUF4406)
MRVYISGAMTGIPNFGRDAFAAKLLCSQGHQVFNPCENDAKTYGSDILDNETGDPDISEAEHGFSLRKALKADLDWICDRAEAIALLPGWEYSSGAVLNFPWPGH